MGAVQTIREWTPKLARDLRVIGLINIQYCVQDNQVPSPSITPVLLIPLNLALSSCGLSSAESR